MRHVIAEYDRAGEISMEAAEEAQRSRAKNYADHERSDESKEGAKVGGSEESNAQGEAWMPKFL
jgi:hypothetical protein